MTNKEFILDCLIQDDEAFTQIVEYFEFDAEINISPLEVKKLLEEMLTEGYIAINYKWKNEHDEYPYSLTEKGKNVWRNIQKSDNAVNIGNIDKYCLHDCTINKLEIKNSELVLCFYDGIYQFDSNDNIKKNNNQCNIIIGIAGLLENKFYEHISISIFKKNTRKSIRFKKFCKLLEKNSFRIYLDFYSKFAQGILIKGHVNKLEVELLITDINYVQFVFNEE